MESKAATRRDHGVGQAPGQVSASAGYQNSRLSSGRSSWSKRSLSDPRRDLATSRPQWPMVARILARLAPTERAIYDAMDVPESLKHNCADAIGVGLFHLGRLVKRRVV